MNREIKFRVWDTATKTMHPTKEFSQKDIMQYTGLKDCNGKEIYEGDIVKFSTVSRKKVIKVVEWDESGRWLPFCDDEFIQDEQGDWFKWDGCFEVIGNVYENTKNMALQ